MAFASNLTILTRMQLALQLVAWHALPGMLPTRHMLGHHDQFLCGRKLLESQMLLCLQLWGGGRADMWQKAADAEVLKER
jgi:hypothetical protein